MGNLSNCSLNITPNESSSRITCCRGQVDFQRAFLPHKEIPLLNPVTTFICDFHIKVENDQSKNQPHFTVSKANSTLVSIPHVAIKDDLLSSKAISWAKMEWLKDISSVIHELGIPKETFRVEGIRILEIFFTTVKCPLVYREISLRSR